MRKILLGFAATAALVLASISLAIPSASADTPGCVTRAEFLQARRGMTPRQVSAIFDVPGRVSFLSGFDGWSLQSRDYHGCKRYSYISVDFERDGGNPYRMTSKTGSFL